MKARVGLIPVLVAIAVGGPLGVAAQTRDVTVPYLRAATGSLPDRANVTFDAVYLPDQGMTEARGWNMRGRGFCRFSVRDPQTATVFSNLYCNQDSKPFRELIKVVGPKLVHFTGYRGDGDGNEPSLYITGAEVLDTPVKPPEEEAANSKSLRVIIKDKATGNRTVLANVVPGKSYSVDGLTITVEAEKEGSAQEKTGTGNP